MMKNRSMRMVTLVGLALMAGCSMINEHIAMGEGQGAADAVRKIDSQAELFRIARSGKDIDARILAISKLNDVDCLVHFVVSKEEAGLRDAAFNRLVELQAVEGLLAKGNVAFATVVARGWTDKTGSTGPIPVEYRTKALEYLAKDGEWSKILSSETFTHVMLDEGNPVKLREFSARYASGLSYGGGPRMKRLFEAAADERNPSREDLVRMLKTYYQFNAHEAEFASVDGLSLRAEKLRIKCRIEGALASQSINRSGIVADIMIPHLRKAVGSRDRPEESAELARFMIEQVDDPQVLGIFVKRSVAEFSRYYGQGKKDVDKVVDYLIAAVNRIHDDSVLLEIVKGKEKGRILTLAPAIARSAVERVQDAGVKAKLDAYVSAWCSPDVKDRGKALVKAYEIDSEFAFEIVVDWFSDEDEWGRRRINNAVNCVASVTDLKTLKFIYARSKAYHANHIMTGVREGVLASFTARIQAISSEKIVQELVKAQSELSEKLAAEGKAFVIAGRYVGMPLESFIALNVVGDIKVTPLDIDLDAQGERFLVTSMSLSSADRYKATGLEKSEVVFNLPTKAKIARFDFKTTGDGLFSSIKKWYSSENQAKGVVVDFYDKSGELVISKIED